MANVTRRNLAESLALAADIPLRPVVHPYPLIDANQALHDLRSSRSPGAKVLCIGD